MAGTGFTSVSDYLNANAGTVGREQEDLAGDVGGQLAGAKSAADAVYAGVPNTSDYTALPGYGAAAGKEQAALDSAKELNTQGGLQDLLQQHFGKTDPGYTQGKAAFDAELLAGAPGFEGVQGQAKSLEGYLEGQGAKIPAPPVPVQQPNEPDQPDKSKEDWDRRGGPPQPKPVQPPSSWNYPKPRAPQPRQGGF